MGMSAWKRAGVALTATAVVTGVAGCQDGGDAEKAAEAPVKAGAMGLGEVTKALTAAFRKTSEAKSAKVTMRIVIATPQGGEGSGAGTVSGVVGWNPSVADLTVSDSTLLAADPAGPQTSRMLMLGGAMYMDMGAERAAQMDGKRWMKIDLKAAAEASGDKALQKQMTAGLDNMNQDPSQQLALLVESPNVKHLGEEKINGVTVQHYKGELTVEEMVATNKNSPLTAEQRKSVIAAAEKAGISGYDTELWVDKDNYPVRMTVKMQAAEALTTITADYSDYGAEAAVQAPPAEDTVDLFALLKQAEQG
ncbi:hypothetical protein ABZ135_02100 [Streptomyces sp. NPDC006339]|uniref:hypothetical protein n=1 Tax=Streptomyces sp. NPDC006339 TaxID=3156755 RepID=UPI0033A4DB3C